MEIRPAEAGDGPAITRLIAALGYDITEDDVDARLAAFPDSHHVVVAVGGPDHEVIGWAHVAADHSLIVGDRAYLGGIAVHEDWRGRGVAAALLDAAERWAFAGGHDIVTIRSGTERRGAHGFYRSHGYIPRKTQLVFDKRLRADGGR